MPQWAWETDGSERRAAICAPNGVVVPVGKIGWGMPVGVGVCAPAREARSITAVRGRRRACMGGSVSRWLWFVGLGMRLGIYSSVGGAAGGDGLFSLG